MPESEMQFECPIDLALHVLGSKWAIPILRDLCQRRRRTSELMRSLVGISPRTLSERLRELEEWGLITRNVYAEIPPRVEYGLTETGADVHMLMVALEELGNRWKDKLPLSISVKPCMHCGRDTPARRCEALADFQGMNEQVGSESE